MRDARSAPRVRALGSDLEVPFAVRAPSERVLDQREDLGAAAADNALQKERESKRGRAKRVR